VAEKAAATGGDRLAQLTAGVRILLDSVNRDLIAREELQAAEFDKLKSEVAKIAEVTAAAAATQGKRAELSVTLPAKEVFDAKGKLTPVAAKFLRDLVANAKSLETSPALRIETHANKLESSEPHKALQLTIAQASVLSSAVIAAGADPALVVAAGYGTTKPLVNEFDRYGKLVPGAVERNSRIVFFLERRPLDTDKIFEKNTNLRAKEIPK
jgi:outer membrane protein OmpA-like peptidoglycan-associated protein